MNFSGFSWKPTRYAIIQTSFIFMQYGHRSSTRLLLLLPPLQSVAVPPRPPAPDAAAEEGHIPGTGVIVIRYRVTHMLGKTLPLTWFRQFRQLVGRYCSCLLPRQDGGIFHIQVNRSFSLNRMVTLCISPMLCE